MRVLVVGSKHRANVHGKTIAIHGLAAALRDRGHEVTLVQTARPRHRVVLEGVRHVYFESQRSSRYPLLFASLSPRGFDWVHTHDGDGVYLALRGRLRSVPWVAEFHPPFLSAASWWSSSWRWRNMRLAARCAPRLLCHSRYLAGQLVARYGVDRARIRVVPLGVNPAWFTAMRPPGPRADGPLRVALVNAKGVEVALRAFARARLARDARLEIYGWRKDLGEHRALAASLGLAERVAFAGFVAQAELPARVAGADLLLHATPGESFGQVLAEAAALGIPALASDVTAVSELVEHGVTGLLCPPRDADAFAAGLDALLGDGALRERLGRAARARAESRWRWDAVAARLEEEVYARI